MREPRLPHLGQLTAIEMSNPSSLLESKLSRLALSSKEFSAGSVRNFIMSVETPLGPLLYLRVWHDNSGQKGKASWFLNMINVLDLQTGEK